MQCACLALVESQAFATCYYYWPIDQRIPRLNLEAEICGFPMLVDKYGVTPVLALISGQQGCPLHLTPHPDNNPLGPNGGSPSHPQVALAQQPSPQTRPTRGKSKMETRPKSCRMKTCSTNWPLGGSHPRGLGRNPARGAGRRQSITWPQTEPLSKTIRKGWGWGLGWGRVQGEGLGGRYKRKLNQGKRLVCKRRNKASG